MKSTQALIGQCNAGALDQALKVALPGKVIGVSTYGPDMPITMFLEDSASAGDIVTAQALATAHDPVFLGTNKKQIAADGIEMAGIIVQAPKPGAANVVLTVTVSGVSQDLPITLVSGIGT